MRTIWTLAAALSLTVELGLTAGPALAQGLIPPSRQYLTPKREGLDKSYGLPTFGSPSPAMPKQETMAPKPQQADRPPDPFQPMPSFARPDTSASAETPDFFQKPGGLAAAPGADVPNFFQDSSEDALPKTRTSEGGDTPLFTTGGGQSPDD